MEVRPGYKETEVGVIPEEWAVIPLSGTARRISRGASPRPIDSPKWFDARSSVGWVRISDVTRSHRYLEETTQRLSVAGIRNSRYVPSGSLIMSICATVGRPIETRIDTCIHDGFVVFDQPTVNQAFLYHVLADLEPTWSRRGQTGSQMNLNTGLINGRMVAIPSASEEQRAIATALSDVDALLGGLERLIAKKRDLKQAAMQQLLTGKKRLPGFSGEWGVKSLADMGTWRGGMTPSMQNPAYWDGGDFPWISSGDVKVSRLADTSQHVTSLAVRHCAAVVVPADSIVLVTRSGILRKYLPVALVQKPMAINQDIKALIPNEAVSAEFLLHAINGYGGAILASCLKAGTTVESVEFTWLKAFVIPLPPRVEQTAIAAVLSDMDAELSALEARRDKTRALKQGMMQELLTGKTRLVATGGAHV